MVARALSVIRPWISQDEAHQLLRELDEANLKIILLAGAEEQRQQCAAQLDEAEEQVRFLTTALERCTTALEQRQAVKPSRMAVASDQS
jgi:hypothetical protein